MVLPSSSSSSSLWCFAMPRTINFSRPRLPPTGFNAESKVDPISNFLYPFPVIFFPFLFLFFSFFSFFFFAPLFSFWIWTKKNANTMIWYFAVKIGHAHASDKVCASTPADQIHKERERLQLLGHWHTLSGLLLLQSLWHIHMSNDDFLGSSSQQKSLHRPKQGSTVHTAASSLSAALTSFMYYWRACSTNTGLQNFNSVGNGNILEKVMVFLRCNKLLATMMMCTLSLSEAYIVGKPTYLWKNIKASLAWFVKNAAGNWVMQTPAKVHHCQIKS